MADRLAKETARRRLRGRNIAVLFALIAFVALIYLVTVVRLQTGLDATLEREGQRGAGSEAILATEEETQ